MGGSRNTGTEEKTMEISIQKRKNQNLLITNENKEHSMMRVEWERRKLK